LKDQFREVISRIKQAYYDEKIKNCFGQNFAAKIIEIIL